MPKERDSQVFTPDSMSEITLLSYSRETSQAGSEKLLIELLRHVISYTFFRWRNLARNSVSDTFVIFQLKLDFEVEVVV